jgi:uncharacterized membrane protein
MTWRGETTIKDRLFACLPYALPLVSVIPFGSFLMGQFPPLQFLFLPLMPVIFIYGQIPFAGIVVFFLLFLLVVRNEKVPHFIRFNAMQAILLDIALTLCSLLLGVLMPALGQSLVTETLFNIIFLGTLAACIYAIVQSVLGRYAELPTISEAVYAQVR